MTETKTPHKRAMKSLGPLHDLLLEACPPNEQGVQSIPILAEALGMTAYGVYKWIENVKIPSEKAQKVVEVSKGPKGKDEPRVKLEQFYPYIFV